MFERESTIIRDGSKLTYDYVPRTLVKREGQMQKLSMIFRTVVDGNLSETAFLTGSVGTGKTATAKRFIADMMEYGSKHGIPMDSIIINCRQKNSESMVLLSCIQHYDQGYPDRGFSPAEMLRSLKLHIEKSGKRLIIVFDEVDALLNNSTIDIIYQLSRFNEERMGKTFSVSLILISQEYALDKLDDASLSTFRRANTIRFSRYTREELREILQTRADEALVMDSYNPDALELIADISAEMGDARFAIDLLDKAARNAECRKDAVLDAEDVRAVNEMVYSVVNEPKLEMLSTNELYTLLAIARSIKNNSYVSITAAEKTYAIVCEEYNTTPRKHTQFWTYVQAIEKKNLVVTSVVTTTGGGRTTMISVPDIPSKILAKKVERILDSEMDEGDDL